MRTWLDYEDARAIVWALKAYPHAVGLSGAEFLRPGLIARLRAAVALGPWPPGSPEVRASASSPELRASVSTDVRYPLD